MTQFTIQQTMPVIATVLAGWLMVRAGVSKRLLSSKTPPRCAACGRRRTGRRCDCT